MSVNFKNLNPAWELVNAGLRAEDLNNQKTQDILNDIQESTKHINGANEILRQTIINSDKIEFTDQKSKELIDRLRDEGFLSHKHKNEYSFKGKEVQELNHALTSYKDRYSQQSNLAMMKLEPQLSVMLKITESVKKSLESQEALERKINTITGTNK